MKKQYFSLGIFKETLKQTAPYAIFVTLLYGLMSFTMISESLPSAAKLIALDIGISPIVPMLFSAVVTAAAFSFITSATGSDFFGAIRESKLTKLVSAFIAVLVHSMAPVILVTCVSSLIFGVFQYPERLYLSEHIVLLTNIFSGCFLSGALTLMGMLLMGRWLSGLVFALQCLYLPLMIVLLVGDLSVSGLSRGMLDLTLFQTAPVWAVSNYQEMSTSLVSVPITIVTGCVALLIAYLTFQKRGYEISRAKTDKKIQTVFNILCAMPFALLAAGEIEKMYTMSNKANQFVNTRIPELFAYLILALFTAVACDVICSRSFKKFFRGVLGAFISVCLVIIVVGVGIFIDTATDDMPIKVQSFKVISNQHSIPPHKNMPARYGSYSFKPKTVVELEKLSFKDSTGKVEEALNSKSNLIESFGLNVSVSGTAGVRFEAVLHMNNIDRENILQAFMKEDWVKKKVLKIERPSSRIMVIIEDRTPFDELTKKKQKEIYKTFYEEYNSLTTQQKMAVAGYEPGSFGQIFNVKSYNKNASEEIRDLAKYIFVFRPCGPDNYLTEYKIYADLMPNTYLKIVDNSLAVE